MSSVQWLMESPIGPIYLVASEIGLQGVLWRPHKKASRLKSLATEGKTCEILRQTVRQLQEYFAGKRTNFNLPIDRSGTEFQMRVWNQLQAIPFGQTCSYSDIAKRVNNQKAVRAVGTANGRNPLSIIVPCHRVIAANGTLGGYAGGLEIKTKLLHLEKTGRLE